MTSSFLRALFLFLAVILLSNGSVSAQQRIDSLTFTGRALLQNGQWKEASAVLGEAYKLSQGDRDLYYDYLSALLKNRDYRAAESLVNAQAQSGQSPVLMVDLGRVHAAAGKQSKADAAFGEAVKAVTGDEMLTQQLVSAFTAAGQEVYAIQVYERVRAMMQNPYLYSGQLSKLYARTGDISKAIDALLNGGPTPFGGGDDTRAQLMDILGEDPAKLAIAQKAIIRRINLQPDNTYYADLLVWLYTQKGDWDGALLQVLALDERKGDGGQELLRFAQGAEREGQYEIALKSLAAVVEKGKATPYYALASGQRLNMAMNRLRKNPSFTKEEVSALAQDFASFFSEFPEYVASDAARDYAELEALYNGNTTKGIELLEKAIAHPAASKEAVGKAKLQLGDYLIIEGKVWEASLTYSQVDKAFREDYLGEDARFRNGRLAYYRGDFAWAQAQLSVLKASTSELIANDALNLSVLITENTPDSNTAPLLLFSRADLLLFQNRHEETLKTLDSITTLYPKHPLQDDVLMLRATLAHKRRDYAKALEYLAAITKDHSQDVLGDDALFKTAEILERAIKDAAKAKDAYEQLIIDYPGSTYVQVARNRLAQLTAADNAQRL